MIIIIVAILIIVFLFQCRRMVKAMKPEKEKIEQSLDNLATISSLQEEVLVDQNRSIDALKKEITSLKRKLNDMDSKE